MNRNGFSLAELVVVLGIIAILAVISVPLVSSWWQAEMVRAATEEFVSILNRGRQLAIARNGNVCIAQNIGRIRFELNGCGGAPWVGAGTDPGGWFALQSGGRVLNNPGVVFTGLGAAVPAGVYTVRMNNRQTTVTVAGSGRITTP